MPASQGSVSEQVLLNSICSCHYDKFVGVFSGNVYSKVNFIYTESYIKILSTFLEREIIQSPVASSSVVGQVPYASYV